MRNLFGSYRKKEDLKAIADAKPKGVHHTVKFQSSYNETWDHIYNETKKIGLPDEKEKCFVSEERYSYDANLLAKQYQVKENTSIAPNRVNQHKAVHEEEQLLELGANDGRKREPELQNATKTEVSETSEKHAELQSWLDRQHIILEEMVVVESKEKCTQRQEHDLGTSDTYLSENKSSDSDRSNQRLNVVTSEERRKETASLQREEHALKPLVSTLDSSSNSFWQEQGNSPNALTMEEESILLPLLYQNEDFCPDDDKKHELQEIALGV